MSGSRAKRLLANPVVTTVVVEHKDRLGRMNVELIEAALSATGRRLMVLNEGEVEDDLVRDTVEVLTSFCARLYGLGHPIRRRTAPPPQHQSDAAGHRTAQAGPDTRGREETRPRLPGPRTGCVQPHAERTRETRTPKTVRDVRSAQVWVQDSLLLTD